MADSPRTFLLLVRTGASALQRWELDAIEQVRALAGASVVVAPSSGSAPDVPRGSFASKQFIAFIASAKGSHCLHHAKGIDAAQDASATTHADAVLCLGKAVHSGPPPTHGVWRFVTEEGGAVHDNPPGAAAAILGRAVVQFHLVNEANAHLLRTGCFAVRKAEPMGTVDAVLRHAACWPSAVVRMIMATGHASSEGTAPPPQQRPMPGNMAMLVYRFSRMIMGTPVHDPSASAFDDWNIGVLHQPAHVLLQENTSTNVRWFPAPGKGKGRLEPFGYHADDELNVLYRKADIASTSGIIARLRPKPDNILKRSRTMLDIGTNHSYPYIVHVGTAAYLLRGGTDPGRTWIHRINATNDGLEEGKELLPAVLHAPTLFEHDGHWWLMGTCDPLPEAELHIYFSTSAFGPFVPHALNPVRCDVRNAKPAGTPFVHNGVLWRPTLDTSDPGRCAVVINKVIELSPQRFAEVAHRRVDGFPSTSYGNGVRTICAMGDITLVDGLRSPVLEGSKANGSRGKSKSKSKSKSRSRDPSTPLRASKRTREDEQDDE